MSETTNRKAKALNTRAGRKERGHAYEIEADAIKALAHPKRLLILDLLSSHEERTVGDLQELAGISQANLSQNLAILRNAGLVATRREGNLMYYRLADERVSKATEMLRRVALERSTDDDVREVRMEAKNAATKRRNTLVGAGLGFALLAGMALGALHPLLNGGNWADVETHVRVLLASPNLGTLAQTCREATTTAPAMPPMGSPPA